MTGFTGSGWLSRQARWAEGSVLEAIGDGIGDGDLAAAVARGMVALGLVLPGATWSNAAIAYTGMGVNVTDTASAAGSKLLDLQVGGVSKFNVSKGGLATSAEAFSAAGDGSAVAYWLGAGGRALRTVSGAMYIDTGNASDLIFRPNVTERMRITANGHIIFGSGGRWLGTDLGAAYYPDDGVVGGAITNGGGFRIYTGGNNERMRITAAGNVGIGNSNPAALLHVGTTTVNNSGLIRSSAGNGVASSRTWYFGCDQVINPYGFTVGDVAQGSFYYGIQYGDGVHIFQSGTTPAERMRIDSVGNVGLGTSSPVTALHTYRSSGYVASRVTSGAVSLDFAISGSTAYIASFAAGVPLTFQTVGAEQMRLHASGDLSIGSSTSILAQSNRRTLTVNGATDSLLTLGIGGTEAAYFYTAADRTEIAALGNKPLLLHTNSSMRVYVGGNGNVGIGTTSPQYRLDVDAGTAQGLFRAVNTYAGLTRLVFANKSDDASRRIDFQIATGSTLAEAIYLGVDQGMSGYKSYLDNRSGGPFVISNSGTVALHVATNGKVGLGNSAPAFTLDASGNGRFAAADNFGHRALYLQNLSTAATTNKWTALSFYGSDTGGTGKEAALIYASPSDADWTASMLAIYVRSGNAISNVLNLESDGTVNFAGIVAQAAAGVASTHKLRVKIAGTTYYLLATNVA